MLTIEKIANSPSITPSEAGRSSDGTVQVVLCNFETYPDAEAAQGDAAVANTPINAPSILGTLDQLADYLTTGYWTWFGGSPRQFDVSVDNVITVNISALNADGQKLAMAALEAWEMVADLEFVVVTGAADITISDDDPAGAYATATVSGGYIISAFVNVPASWVAFDGPSYDTYSFGTYIHEIGHALGLGHQGPYNVSANFGTDALFLNDSWQMSIMSYFSQTDNTFITASFAYNVTLAPADILAIQNLYGAPIAGSATDGDTTYGANSNVDTYLGELFAGLAGEISDPDTYFGYPVTMTIYDPSGIDTVDLSFSTTDDRIDLTPGAFSDIGGLIGNVGIEQNTILENVIAGSGNDTISGNGASNYVDAGSGHDLVEPGVGFDTVFGRDGNDTVTAKNGWDVLYGGPGDDLLNGNAGWDTIYGEEGNDTLNGGKQPDSIYGGPGDDHGIGKSGADHMEGGDGMDTLDGNAGPDTLLGGEGDDVLNGGINFDQLDGGPGNDRLNGNNGADTLTGGDGNDTLVGNAGTDLISGGDGVDMMFGGIGADSFAFNTGDDTDTISDFATSVDLLVLDAALLGGQDLASYASVSGTDLILDFGNGDVLTLVDVTDVSEVNYTLV